MIVWTRWGIVMILGLPITLAINYPLLHLLGLNPDDRSPNITALFGVCLMLSGVVMYFVERYVVRGWLDRPKPVWTTVPLLQPYVDQTGRTQTQQAVQAVDEQGRPIMQHFKSTLFFIPTPAWPFIYAIIGLGVAIYQGFIILTSSG